MEYEEGQQLRWIAQKNSKGEMEVACPDCGAVKPWYWRRSPVCTACGLKWLMPPEGCGI